MPGLETAAGLVVVVSLIAYTLSGGADFGGGVWDLLARGPRAARQRRWIAHSIGPIWEANHIWLILAIVVLATAFPPAFARISTVLHVPLLLMLLGIVARGAAFSFRAYGEPEGEGTAAAWGRLFAIASLVTPLLAGIVAGAIVSGRLQPPRSAADFLDAWARPFPFAVGAFTVVLFAFLAAVYLAHDARHAPPDGAGGAADLSEDFRWRALAAGLLLGPLAAGMLAAAWSDAPWLAGALLHAPWSWGFFAASGAGAAVAIAALARRRFGLARAAAAAQCSLLVAGWAIAQFPFLVPPDLTLAGAAAPAATLRFLLGALAAGAALLLPAFFYLYRIFGRLPVRSPRAR